MIRTMCSVHHGLVGGQLAGIQLIGYTLKVKIVIARLKLLIYLRHVQAGHD